LARLQEQTHHPPRIAPMNPDRRTRGAPGRRRFSASNIGASGSIAPGRVIRVRGTAGSILRISARTSRKWALAIDDQEPAPVVGFGGRDMPRHHVAHIHQRQA
jgi:hypothetical protein